MFPQYILLHTTEHINLTVLLFPFHKECYTTLLSVSSMLKVGQSAVHSAQSKVKHVVTVSEYRIISC